MAQVRFARGTETQIDAAPLSDGTIYMSSDTGKMLIDIGGERIEIGYYDLPMASEDEIGGVKVESQVDSTYITANSGSMVPLVIADESNDEQTVGKAYVRSDASSFESNGGTLYLREASSSTLGGVKIDDQIDETASNVPTSQAVMDFVESSMSSVDEISISSTEPTEPNVKLWIKI